MFMEINKITLNIDGIKLLISMNCRMVILFFILYLAAAIAQEDSQCYTADGDPVRCMPKFINIAFKAQVFSSNTCGNPKSEFCVQQEIGLPFNEDNCYICDKG